jgi:putative toxin-antitoxin system antitoxin component (TIGR02293 family)
MMTADEIVAMSVRVFGDAEKAARWMGRPKHRFDGKSPNELLDTEDGVEKVRQMLGRIEYGMFA